MIKNKPELKDYFNSKRGYLSILTLPFALFLFLLKNLFNYKLYTKKFIEYPSTNKKTIKPNFYVISEPKLIKSLLATENALESQIKQPYLIIDSNFKFKLNEHEFDRNLNEYFMHKLVHKTKSLLIDQIINDQFNQFLKKAKSKLNSNKDSMIDIKQKDICILVFNILSHYLNSLFGQKDKKLNKNYRKIFKYLIQMNKRYNLRLFFNNKNQAQSIEYSNLFSKFMKLVEIEFKINTEYTSDVVSMDNLDFMKFLFIKNAYLNFIKVSACLIRVLNDVKRLDALVLSQIRTASFSLMQSGELCKFNSLNALARSYLVKCLNLDLYLVKRDFFKENYFFPQDSFISMNLSTLDKQAAEDLEEFYVKQNNYSNPDNLILVLSQTLIFNLLRNFDFCEQNLNFQKKNNFSLNFYNLF